MFRGVRFASQSVRSETHRRPLRTAECNIAMSTEKPRFSITVDDELFKRLEDYRFENRCPNRSQAVVELIRQSLDEYDKNKMKKIKNFNEL